MVVLSMLNKEELNVFLTKNLNIFFYPCLVERTNSFIEKPCLKNAPMHSVYFKFSADFYMTKLKRLITHQFPVALFHISERFKTALTEISAGAKNYYYSVSVTFQKTS